MGWGAGPEPMTRHTLRRTGGQGGQIGHVREPVAHVLAGRLPGFFDEPGFSAARGVAGICIDILAVDVQVDMGGARETFASLGDVEMFRRHSRLTDKKEKVRAQY